MASLDRRNSMTLDEVGRYLRELRNLESPSQNKVCNSIITIDLAFEGTESSLSQHLSKDKWDRIRTELFDILISSFPGYWNVYEEGSLIPLELRADWPDSGYIEFCPTRSNRQSDILRADLSTIHPSIVLAMRWCWAEGQNQTTVENFKTYRESRLGDQSEEAQTVREFLDRLFETCVTEAEKSKRIAHRAWWRLSSEVSSCQDKQTVKQLKKKMLELENVWGLPSA
ncbi:hypothetical protein KF913_04170 [Candidatus Obscuribacterales bacterium]|nr:hypothetical protein [Candidatus Obscuribacterales bacterium]